MSKFGIALIAVSAVLTADVAGMKGGQILHQPLPFTVYILTGDTDDVFFMRKKSPKHQTIEGEKTTPIGNSSVVGERYGEKEVRSSTPRSYKVGSTSAASVTETAGIFENNGDGHIPPDVQKVDEEKPYSLGKEAVETSGSYNAAIEQKEVSSGKGPATDDSISGIVGEKNSASGEGLTKSVPVEEEHAPGESASEGTSPSPDIAPGEGKSDHLPSVASLGENAFKDTTPSSSTAETTDEIPASGCTAATEGAGQCGTASPNGIPVDSSWKHSRSTSLLEHFNSSTPSPPHCKLAAAASTASPVIRKPPRPEKLWRFCMGVVFDERTIVTGGICFAQAEGLHFFVSVNATNHTEAQEVTKIVEGRHLFDFRVIRLNENQTLPGAVPDWQDEETVYWNIEEMSNLSRTGIVPSFGFPPKVAALKLLPIETCQMIYYELLEAYPAQTSTLHGYLVDTVVCATQADKPIRFPDGSGFVEPGLACPDSLGAPFVLDDGTILGVLVAADCRFKNVAFFQTLGKGLPTADEDDDESDF